LKILIADGYNLLYRARSGYLKGDNPIVFNFIRSFKALVEKFNPDITYFVLEGIPKKRKQLLPEYKAQRVYTDLDDFVRQRGVCISLLRKYLPVKVVLHEDHECDDVIGALAKVKHPNDECIIISSDTDFIQLLSSSSDKIKLYNPIKKVFIEAPEYDYVMWKALTGDKSDNIPGFDRVGPATARKLVTNAEKLEKFLSVEDRLTLFEKNIELIRLENVDCKKLQISKSVYHSNEIKNEFKTMKFTSLLSDKYWNNFERVFSNGAKHARHNQQSA
jgi:DNA polymerase-1